MPQLGFSGPNLATVAYAEVAGTNGASTAMNSGITTTRVSQGVYVAVLPANNLQTSSRDLIFVQPKGTSVLPKMAVVDDSLDATKTIYIWDGDPAGTGPTTIDSDFSLIILRTTISPPAGSPS